VRYQAALRPDCVEGATVFIIAKRIIVARCIQIASSQKLSGVILSEVLAPNQRIPNQLGNPMQMQCILFDNPSQKRLET
jgi:hypothetical protein